MRFMIFWPGLADFPVYSSFEGNITLNITYARVLKRKVVFCLKRVAFKFELGQVSISFGFETGLH